MIIGEVGLNHLGKEEYANEYIDFHLNNNFECLSFQIRENEFYKRKEKSHLWLKKSFYKKIANKYSKIKKKKIGLSVSNLDSFRNIINLKFDFYKILSIAAKDTNLINTLLEKTNADIYISIGSLNLKEINKIIKTYIKNNRVRFNYTQLHPDEMHAFNFKDFKKLLNKIDEINKILGIRGKFFSKNDIPDQKQK